MRARLKAGGRARERSGGGHTATRRRAQPRCCWWAFRRGSRAAGVHGQSACARSAQAPYFWAWRWCCGGACMNARDGGCARCCWWFFMRLGAAVLWLGRLRARGPVFLGGRRCCAALHETRPRGTLALVAAAGGFFMQLGAAAAVAGSSACARSAHAPYFGAGGGGARAHDATPRMTGAARAAAGGFFAGFSRSCSSHSQSACARSAHAPVFGCVHGVHAHELHTGGAHP